MKRNAVIQNLISYSMKRIVGKWSSLLILLPVHGITAVVVVRTGRVLLVVILTRVGNLVFQDFDELVEDNRDEGANWGSDPVDPLVCPYACESSGTKRASRVQGAASVVDTDELGNEEGETDADRPV